MIFWWIPYFVDVRLVNMLVLSSQNKGKNAQSMAIKFCTNSNSGITSARNAEFVNPIQLLLCIAFALE